MVGGDHRGVAQVLRQAEAEGPRTEPLIPYYKDSLSIRMTELLEFGLSLSHNGKDSVQPLPHLQAYKVLRAYELCESGQLSMASR